MELGPGVMAEPCPSDRFMSKLKVAILSQKFGGWFVTEMRKQTTPSWQTVHAGGERESPARGTLERTYGQCPLFTCRSLVRAHFRARGSWEDSSGQKNSDQETAQEDLSETSRRCCFIYCLGID